MLSSGITLALTLAVAVLGLQLQPEGGGARLGETDLIDAGPMAGPFTISGDVDGLYPGAHVALPLSLHNTNPYGLRIDSLTVMVGASDHAGCGAAHVVPGPWTGPIFIAANATVVTNVSIDMLATAPDACQGATFPLTYTGLGQRFPLPTQLRADPVIAEVLTPTKVSFGRFSARLWIAGTTEPVPGKTIVFHVANKPVCSAVTDATGRGTCGAIVNSLQAVLALNYKVTFAGDAQYEPSQAIGPLLRISLVVGLRL